MKIVDEREMQSTTKKTNKDRKEQGGTEAMVKGGELNDSVVQLNLRKPKVRQKRISSPCILHQYRVLQNLRKKLSL